MNSKSYIVFAANHLTERYGGKIKLVNNIVYIDNGKDEFYCDLINKTEKNKFRFWHRCKGQEEYHRQIDRKNIVAGMYQCLTHTNKYIGISYDRQKRISMQREIENSWKKVK